MDKNIELRHLRYFVAVAEDLHFGRAATRLHVSQPPLSQQIRKLEEILGHALFQRTSRSVRLTPAGEAFLESAHRTLRNVQRGMEESRSIAAGQVGSIRIGFVGSAMLIQSLPGMLSRYRKAYPQVRMQFHESFTSRVIQGLEDGSLDAGILRDSDPMESLEVRTILKEPFVAVVPRGHPAARHKSISPGALRGDPMVYFPVAAGARAHEKPLSIFEQYGFRPQVVQEASHWLTILRLVGAGLGMTVAPACVQRIATSDVVCLKLRDTKVLSHLELAHGAGESRALVDRFAQMVLKGR